MISRTIVLVGIAACLLALDPTVVRGDPGQPIPTGDVIGPSVESPAGPKSETTALLWSLLGTAVPVVLSAPRAFGESDGPDDGTGVAVLFLGALVVGPSLGHFYAARPGRAFGGIALRTLAFFGLAGAVAMSWDSESSGANGLAFASLALGAGMIIWDIAAAPASARTYNEKSQRRKVALVVTPPTRTRGTGLVACMSF